PGPPGSMPSPEHRRHGRVHGRALVLNATYEPINVCSVRRAAVLLLKAKAELVEHSSWELRSEHTALPRPVVIRLVSYVRMPRDGPAAHLQPRGHAVGPGGMAAVARGGGLRRGACGVVAQWASRRCLPVMRRKGPGTAPATVLK